MAGEEPIFNLFVYVERDTISELGVAVHEAGGTDREKLDLLLSLVDADYKVARRFQLTTPLDWDRYEGMMRLGRQLHPFENAFIECGAPTQPLVVVTPIVDGEPRILAQIGIGPLYLDDLRDTPLAGPGAMVDYLKKYRTENGFDGPQLLHDDHFTAIRLLFNSGHYVSAGKLLMSFIDTVSFIESGDRPGSFTLWLQSYADLTSLGVTAHELWEFRNGLLHMTNLHSRAVRKGNIARLSMYVGNVPESSRQNTADEKYFNLKNLIEAVAAALSRWFNTYNADPDKFVDFVRRYDLTVSDARLTSLE